MTSDDHQSCHTNNGKEMNSVNDSTDISEREELVLDEFFLKHACLPEDRFWV